MKILVIGNGFDLEHGLPTMYKDFLKYIRIIGAISGLGKDENIEVVIDRLTTNNAYFNKYFKEIFVNEMLDKNNIINELIELSKNNIWIKYFIDLNFNENKGWIDFEYEISNVIRSLDYMKKYRYKTKIQKEIDVSKNRDANNIENHIEKIIGELPKRIEYLNEDQYNEEITKKLQQHLNDLIRCLEIYLEDCVGKIDIEYVAPDIKNTKFDKVLSFNYTNTYERVYGYSNKGIEYDYIHGKADITRDAGENNMVLGIDEYLDNEAKNRELEFIAFKKYFQRIYKKTGNTYKKWIKKIKEAESERLEREEIERKNIIQAPTGVKRTAIRERIDRMKRNSENEIYIFGHSLDITDKDILKELIECPNTITTIFYHNKEVYAQQITNLVKVIGQDDLIKRVSGANPTIIFRKKRVRRRVNKEISINTLYDQFQYLIMSNIYRSRNNLSSIQIEKELQSNIEILKYIKINGIDLEDGRLLILNTIQELKNKGFLYYDKSNDILSGTYKFEEYFKELIVYISQIFEFRFIINNSEEVGTEYSECLNLFFDDENEKQLDYEGSIIDIRILLKEDFDNLAKYLIEFDEADEFIKDNQSEVAASIN